MGKRISPYARLLKIAREYIGKVKYPKEITMWRYPKDKLGGQWTLTDLYERTKAAEQLGFDVIVLAQDDGLTIQYREKIPEEPYTLKW